MTLSPHYPLDRFGLQRALEVCPQMFNLSYPQLLEMFPEFLDPKRSESASFLIWYLQNYYRLDPVEAVDSVCDQGNDKGIDGIFVNDNDKTITINPKSPRATRLRSEISLCERWPVL